MQIVKSQLITNKTFAPQTLLKQSKVVGCNKLNEREMINNSCLGNFYKNGIENAVETKRDGVKYGYQFWVKKINGEPKLK